MITTKIQVKPFLAEYAKNRFSVEGKEYIQFRESDYMYHVVHNLMSKRPNSEKFDSGNLEIALPHRSRGKCPEIYNYITESGQKIIEQKLNRLFWAHVHEFVDEQVRTHCEPINESVYLFISEFGISEITEDALLKSYYRWREKARRKTKKRKYNAPKKSG